jgi:adenine phosphoribosyltransferase
MSTTLKELAANVTVDTKIKPGVVFRGLTKVLADYRLYSLMLNTMADKIRTLNLSPDYIVGQQSRGFWFVGLCDRLKVGFIPLTKTPYSTNSITTPLTKEYTEAKPEVLCLDPTQVIPGKTVIVIDDLMATGGTMDAAIRLFSQVGVNVVACGCAIELTGFELPTSVTDRPLISVLRFDKDSTSTELDPELNVLVDRVELDYVHRPYSQVDNIVFYVPTKTAKDLASKIVMRNFQRSRLGNIKWDHFADGASHTQIEDTRGLVGRHVDFVIDMTSKTSPLEEQLSALMVIQRKSIASLKIHIPYYSVGTMERAMDDGEVASAETYAEFISGKCEIVGNGKPEIFIYDIHALASRFFFDHSRCNVVLESAIPNLKAVLPKDTIVCFPDDGAQKRFRQFFDNSDYRYRQITMAKTRDGERRLISIKEYTGFPSNDKLLNNDVVIVDDLCQTGSTMIEVYNRLREIGYTNVSMFCTHGVFPNDSYKKFMNIGVKNFYVTRSIEQGHNFRAPFVEIDLIRPYSNSAKPVRVAVSSTNPTKLLAAYNSATAKFGHGNVTVTGFSIPSGVSVQPMGALETYTGAINRQNGLRSFLTKTNQEFDVLISYENGLAHEDGNVLGDVFAVVYEFGNEGPLTKIYDWIDNDEDVSQDLNCMFRASKIGISGYIMSDCITPVPGELYDRCANNSIRENKTVGDYVSEVYGYPSDSWHQYFNEHGLSRLDILSSFTL